MSRNDMLNSVREQLETAREEAIKIGLAEGRAEGRAEGLAEAIRRMLAAGFTTEQICEIMGTTAEEVSAAKGRK